MTAVARALAEDSPEETPWRRRSGTALVDAGVTALNGYIVSVFAYAAGGTGNNQNTTTTTDNIEEFLAVIERLGETLEADLRTSVDDIITGPVALLALADVTPIIEIGIDTGDEGFWDSEYSQRTEMCELVTALADVADVRVLSSSTQRRKLAEYHREDLLGISKATIPHHRSHQRDRDHDETMDAQARAEAAADALTIDGSKVAVLETICSASARNLSYHALTAQCDVSPSRRSQILVTDDDSLASLGLVETYHNGTTKRIEATQAGHRCLELIETEIARQRRLQEYFSEGGNPSDNTHVCTTPHEGPHSPAPSGNDEERQFYDVGWLARHHHAAVAASGDTGAVCLVDQPIDDVDCAAEPAVSYDADRDELVVSVEAQSITQLAVCLSRALAGQKIRERILTDERLDAIDVPEIILRNCRGIGGLSSEAANDPAVLRDNLAHWCERLCQLSAFTTNEARRENEQWWKAARTDLLRGAHGLIGTVVHLFDLLGIDLHREIRFPEYTSDYQGKSRERSIARFLAIGASIQSSLDHFTAYKQLHEHREEKLDGLIRPDVDPTDPYGELIGSIVLVGPGIDAFASPLNHVLNNSKELHEDAPEFAVPIPIRTTDNCNDDRSAFVEAANRVLDTKHLITTPDAVSILQTILQTPYDVATALASLDSEDTRREIRPDELRYALAHHDTERLFPDETATVSTVVETLLTATRPLSSGELADRAGVARKSIQNNRETIGGTEITGSPAPHRRGLSDRAVVSYAGRTP